MTSKCLMTVTRSLLLSFSLSSLSPPSHVLLLITGGAAPIRQSRPYRCDCGRTFSKEMNLERHRKIHTGDSKRPYKCEKCDKAFTSNKDLKQHLTTHSSEKPYRG